MPYNMPVYIALPRHGYSSGRIARKVPGPTAAPVLLQVPGRDSDSGPRP